MKRSKRSADFLQLYDESEQRWQPYPLVFTNDGYCEASRQYPSGLKPVSSPKGASRNFNPFCPAQCDTSSGLSEQCLSPGLFMHNFKGNSFFNQDQHYSHVLKKPQNDEFSSFVSGAPASVGVKERSRRTVKRANRTRSCIKSMATRRRVCSDAPSMSSTSELSSATSSESFGSLAAENELSEDDF